MRFHFKTIAACLAFSALASLTAVEANAQRAISARSGAKASVGTREVRSSATGSVNRGGTGTNVNRNSNVNKNTNINRNTNVNIDRDVDIDVDVDHGWGYGWDDHHYHPGAAIATTAIVTAAVVGSYYRTLPSNCVVVYRGTVTYYQCGTTWYQPVYSGASVQYVVVVAP